jgi:hypothetical protein
VLILLVGAAILVLAVVGLASSVAYFLGFQVNAAPTKTVTKTKVLPPDPSAVNRARAQATAIVKAAESEANRRSKTIQKAAEARALRVLRRAQQQAQHHAQTPVTVPTTVVQPTPPAQLTPVAQPTIPASVPTTTTNNQTGAPLPNLNKVPSTWSVVAYRANPTGHTVNLLNRSTGSFSGTITLTYLSSKGKAVGVAQGAFTHVPAHTSIVVPLQVKRSPSSWVRYVVNVSNIH